MSQLSPILSQLPEDQQQQAQQQLGLGNLIAQPLATPIRRLVILNNKIKRTTNQVTNQVTYAWGRNWPHELAYEP